MPGSFRDKRDSRNSDLSNYNYKPDSSFGGFDKKDKIASHQSEQGGSGLDRLKDYRRADGYDADRNFGNRKNPQYAEKKSNNTAADEGSWRKK